MPRRWAAKAGADCRSGGRLYVCCGPAAQGGKASVAPTMEGMFTAQQQLERKNKCTEGCMHMMYEANVHEMHAHDMLYQLHTHDLLPWIAFRLHTRHMTTPRVSSQYHLHFVSQQQCVT